MPPVSAEARSEEVCLPTAALAWSWAASDSPTRSTRASATATYQRPRASSRPRPRATERAGEDDEAVAASRADAEHRDIPVVGRVVDGLVAEKPDLRLGRCAAVP